MWKITLTLTLTLTLTPSPSPSPSPHQAAHFVWKTLVANAPKALRIILPELTRPPIET